MLHKISDTLGIPKSSISAINCSDVIAKIHNEITQITTVYIQSKVHVKFATWKILSLRVKRPHRIQKPSEEILKGSSNDIEKNMELKTSNTYKINDENCEICGVLVYSKDLYRKHVKIMHAK